MPNAARKIIEDFVQRELATGETISATLSYGRSRGGIGKAVVVTDRRVFVVGFDARTNSPRDAAWYPIEVVTVTSASTIDDETLKGEYLRLQLGTEVLTLLVARLRRAEVVAVVDALGGVDR
jgi:hypothetical protein